MLQASSRLKSLTKTVVKASTLTRVGVGTAGAGGARGVEDSDNNSITINSSLKRTRSRELIAYIRVSYIQKTTLIKGDLQDRVHLILNKLAKPVYYHYSNSKIYPRGTFLKTAGCNLSGMAV